MSIFRATASRQKKIHSLLRLGQADPQSLHLAWVQDKDAGTLGYVDQGTSLVSANEQEMSARFVISTINEDRDGDIVLPSGCRLDTFRGNPAWFWGHQEAPQHPFPIGTSEDPRTGQLAVFPEEKQVTATCFYDQGDPDAVFIFGKVARGFLKAVSIAFLPWEAEKRDNSRERGDIILPPGFIYKSWELTEISHVGVGANAEALRLALDKDPEARKISRRLRKSIEAIATKPGIWSLGWTLPPPRKANMAKKKIAKEDNATQAESQANSVEDRVEQDMKALQDCVSLKIPKLYEEGYGHEQAVAMAFSMCKEGKDLSEESIEETAKALGIQKKKNKEQDEGEDYDPDKNMPEEAEIDEKEEEELEEEEKPFGAQVMRDLVQHFSDCQNYLEKVGPMVEQPDVKQLVEELREEIAGKVAALKESAESIYQLKMDNETEEKDDGDNDQAEAEEGMDEKENDLAEEDEELLDKYKSNGKHKKKIRQLKRLSKKSIGVIREAGEYMEDLAGDDAMPKRHKGGLHYHAAQLLGLGKEDEPEEEEKPAEEKGIDPAVVAEWEAVKKRIFEATGIRNQ
jgi:hypothetical protein